MVEFPSYIRLVSSTPRVAGPEAGRAARSRRTPEETGTSAGLRDRDTVSLVSRENRAAVTASIPTAEEAREALRSLQRDLPSLGPGLGQVHSGLERYRILSLLAPLLE